MDVRQKPSLTHEDIIALNFIRSPSRFYYRRHYRMGLRSHIMEVLSPVDLAKETQGTLNAKIKRFPRARPSKILRIFRTKFRDLKEAEDEIARVKLVQRYLSPQFVARSEEFLVHYKMGSRLDILLCGLQTYVEGEILDPWTPANQWPIANLLKRILPQHINPSSVQFNTLVKKATQNILAFVHRIKRMIHEAEHIPDLAGVGNLLLTREAQIVLVDINNISLISFAPKIPLDDRGYPVCDKSVQALFMLEKKVAGDVDPSQDPIYSHFIERARMKQVSEIERRFHQSMA